MDTPISWVVRSRFVDRGRCAGGVTHCGEPCCLKCVKYGSEVPACVFMRDCARRSHSLEMSTGWIGGRHKYELV
eukprot:31279_5